MLLTYEIVNNCVYIYNHDNRIKVLCQIDNPLYSLDEIAQNYINEQYNQLINYKINEIKSCCDEIITTGFYCNVLDTGNLHYTLSQHKQDEMKRLYQNIINGNSAYVLWRDDSKIMCENYTAEQFLNLYKQALIHILTQKIYLDGLEQYINDLAYDENYSAIENIQFGDTLPKNIQQIVTEQINEMMINDTVINTELGITTIEQIESLQLAIVEIYEMITM